MLDLKPNNWIEAEGIKAWGTAHNREIRDESRATITQEDVWNIQNESAENINLRNLSAQGLLDYLFPIKQELTLDEVKENY